MEIKGMVHCFFEQSGTFKNEFIKLGIPAEDYDIQNNFGETDHVIDLFHEIENEWVGQWSIFRSITKDDLIMAFFPCIYFSDMSQILHTWGAYPNKTAIDATKTILDRSRNRQSFYEVVIKMLAIAKDMGIRLVMENPNGCHSYLKHCFVTSPALVDNDRSLRGDFFRKPTAYWFINCEPTHQTTIERLHKPIRVKKDAMPASKAGQCSEERSMISPDYARNFICDFILGKPQKHSQLSIFD